jgi:hypothetical protein
MQHVVGRELSCTTFVSSIKHKNVTFYRFVTDSFQMAWTKLIWGLQN